MPEQPLVLIRADAPGYGSYLWWMGPCPWPGLPTAWGGDTPSNEPQVFVCCAPNGCLRGLVSEVRLHMPTPGRPAVTVTVSVDDAEHLITAHGFSPDLPWEGQDA